MGGSLDMAVSFKVKTIGDACIIRYNRAEAPELKTIIDVNYAILNVTDRTGVIGYVAAARPDIPYEITETEVPAE